MAEISARAALWAAAAALLVVPGSAHAQSFPRQVLHAKTVVVLNDTHVFAVQQQVEAELKRWNQLRVVSRIDKADLVLSFRLASPAAATPPVLMTASTPDSPAPFFRASCQQDAGRDCAVAFEDKWVAEAARAGVATR